MIDDEFYDIDRTELAELCGDKVLCAYMYKNDLKIAIIVKNWGLFINKMTKSIVKTRGSVHLCKKYLITVTKRRN